MSLTEKWSKAMEILEANFSSQPPEIDDPVAQKTKWSPLKRGGYNGRTHLLMERTPGRLEFQLKGLASLLPVIFMIIGLGSTAIMLYAGLLIHKMLLVLLAPLSGTAFFVTAIFITRNWMIPRTFDLNLGYYWKGKKGPRLSKEECCRLIDIHAIQIIRERCPGSHFFCYEINLILHNGSRLNIVDHGNQRRIRKDASLLAEYMGIPLWDAS